MKRHLLASAILLAGMASATPEGIFDGRSLDGWRLQGAPYWSVRKGVLTGESDAKMLNSVLWTEKSYTDFAVELKFRFTGDLDSGIFLRHENEQIQIGVSRSLKRDMTGSPYIGSKRGYPQEASGVKELLKAGGWNRMKVVAKGDTYTVELNGKQVMEYVSDTAKESGPIGLQVHPGVKMKIEFRDVTVDSL